MKASLALSMMLSPASRAGVVIIPEGTRAAKVLDLLARKGGVPLAQLKAALRHPAALHLPAYADGNAEGFLFPDRYDVNPKKMTAAQVLAAMVARYDDKTASLEVSAGARKLHMTPYQILVVASLVQAEARRPGDFGKVARVVYNRLNSKLAVQRRLQFDSTINYAQGTSTLKLSTKQIQALRSPYNTYTRPGLPPTPIGNPGLQAIQAALNPTPGPWRYFVTVDPKTGETRFTDNLEEFNRWKAEFKRNLGQ
jgi:UPF0755 protein